MVMDVLPGRLPWNLCRTKTPRRWARHQARAGADGDDGNFDGPGQQVRRAGREAACESRAPHKAARGPQAIVDRSIQRPTTATRRCTRRGASTLSTATCSSGPQHGGAGDPAKAGAAGGDYETGQAGAVRQLDDFLAPPRPGPFFRHAQASAFHGSLIGPVRKKNFDHT